MENMKAQKANLQVNVSHEKEMPNICTTETVKFEGIQQ